MRLAASLLLGFLCGCSPDHTPTQTVGSIAPQIAVLDTQGLVHTLKDFKNQNVLLTFWQSSCAPCIQDLPHLAQIHHSGKATVIAVSLDKHFSAAKQAIRHTAPSLPIYADPDLATAKRFGIRATPTHFLINQNGVIQKRIEQPIETAEQILNNPIMREKVQ